MKLSDYIKDMGDVKFAALIGCSKHAARSWRLGERRPRPEQARKIVKKTPITMDEIYGA
jgi:DNA-binding transcriptional regulator YiaG